MVSCLAFGHMLRACIRGLRTLSERRPRTQKMVGGALIRAFLLLLVACASLAMASQLRARIPTDDMPLHVDAVTCDMAECEPMCVCQKLLWSIDYRHPLSLGPGDNHCTHWRKSGALPDLDTCSSACSTLVQHVEAAAGRDSLERVWPRPFARLEPSFSTMR